MAKITIGEAYWATIYGYLNSMFTELYSGIPSKYAATVSLPAGSDYDKQTTIPSTSEPYAWSLLDASGNNISDLILSLTIAGGFWAVKIHSDGALNNCKLKILY